MTAAEPARAMKALTSRAMSISCDRGRVAGSTYR